jgi:hypothetical protein
MRNPNAVHVKMDRDWKFRLFFWAVRKFKLDLRAGFSREPIPRPTAKILPFKRK